jgi:hypothetical protein
MKKHHRSVGTKTPQNANGKNKKHKKCSKCCKKPPKKQQILVWMKM